MDLDSVLILEPGAEFTVTSHAAHSWCSILIPDRLREPFSAETQPPPSTRPCSRLLPADPATMKRLRRTVLQLIDCVRVDPDVLVPPAAVRQMQAELMAACRPFLSPDPPRRAFTGRPRFHRGSLLHQIRRVLDAEAPTFPSVGQLASAVDVSERTLRNVFQDYFGVPPQRYLTIYRLHQVRAALQSADPDATTVTAVAAQFGFWEFGRFAASYRRIFAERPSETLRLGRRKSTGPSLARPAHLNSVPWGILRSSGALAGSDHNG
jgi:AraC family ethanolamine operon transcriptional activator